MITQEELKCDREWGTPPNWREWDKEQAKLKGKNNANYRKTT